MNPYIGDRQLEPDDEYDCPYCGQPFSTKPKMVTHAARCSKNDDIDYPEPYECEE